MKVEIRRKGEAMAVLDEDGNPILALLGKVKNYGRGNQVYLPREWSDKTVLILDLTAFR